MPRVGLGTKPHGVQSTMRWLGGIYSSMSWIRELLWKWCVREQGNPSSLHPVIRPKGLRGFHLPPAAM